MTGCPDELFEKRPLRSLQDIPEARQLPVIGQVRLHGDHRHVVVRQSPFVGVLGAGLAVDELAREPEILAAPGVFVAVELLAPEAAVLAAEFYELS